MAMDNKTVRDAIQIHGTDPQFLIEKILRTRIYESTYWKEHCFGLTESTIIEKAYELTYIGGQYGIQKPTEFICLVLKLLQIQPREEIVIKYITGLTESENNKYLRALGAFYLRLVGKPVDIYNYLEPLLDDSRKLRKRGAGGYSIVHMDEFIDELLREERVCDVVLPRLVKRYVLEDAGELDPRVSTLEKLEMELEEERKAEEAAARGEGSRGRSSSRSQSRSRSAIALEAAPKGTYQNRGPEAGVGVRAGAGAGAGAGAEVLVGHAADRLDTKAIRTGEEIALQNQVDDTEVEVVGVEAVAEVEVEAEAEAEAPTGRGVPTTPGVAVKAVAGVAAEVTVEAELKNESMVLNNQSPIQQ
ncbi:hypothetical protein BGX26_007907 [Mortierella sp. AD094]|nr:hypothetical protein BGX26_007907 [Mortierella sp. AD094]